MLKNIQIISGGKQTPSNSADTYQCLNGGGGSTSEIRAAGISAAAGTIRNFKVKVSAAPGAEGSGKQWDITIYKNGIPTALTVTIFETATSATYSGELIVAQGDYLSVKIDPTNSPTSPFLLTWNTEYISEDNETLLMSNSWSSGTGNLFISVFGNMTNSVNEFYTELLIPCAGTIKNLFVNASAAPGTGKYATFTVRKNQSNQTVIVTLSGAQTNGNDVDHSFVVSPVF